MLNVFVIVWFAKFIGFAVNVAVIVVAAVIVPLAADHLLNEYPVLFVAVIVFKSLVVVPVVIPFIVSLFPLVVYVAPLITL